MKRKEIGERDAHVAYWKVMRMSTAGNQTCEVTIMTAVREFKNICELFEAFFSLLLTNNLRLEGFCLIVETA